MGINLGYLAFSVKYGIIAVTVLPYLSDSSRIAPEAFGNVAPELVDTFDEKTKLLGVYHHDVTNIGGAVLSMAQARIETAEQKIALLEARLTDLERTAPGAPRA